MKNIFNIKRFGNYLVYDLNNLKNQYGLSLLVIGCLPVIYFIIKVILCLIFNKDLSDINMIEEATTMSRTFTFFLGLIIVILSFPTKAYGSLTERKAGSSWLLLPASAFEKWLSMMLISAIVVPVCYIAVYIGSDSLLSEVFGGYGDSFITAYSNLTDTLEAEGVSQIINLPAIVFPSIAGSMLFFLLGAIWFKKSKIAKTILCSMALGLVTSLISSKILISFDWYQLNNQLCDAESIKEFVNSMCKWAYICNYAQIIILMALIGARIKTLKH